jgi:hypothetical protein
MGERRALASLWNAVVCVMVVVALAVQLGLVIRGHDVLVVDGRKPPTGTRVVRFFSYFTVQSNILVALTCGWLAVRPAGRGAVERVLRLDALIGITVTGIIYVTLLRPIVNLSGIPKLTDIAFHYLAPVLTLLGWLLFGPRPRIDDRVLAFALIWPALYVAYCLTYGASTGWYPYPFIDAKVLGYVPALRNGAGILVLLLGVGVIFRWADRWLGQDREAALDVGRPA